MSIMAKTPSGYKKIGSAYLGERPVDKVFNADGDVVYALQRELTGVPPLLFKGKEQSELLNYRIYGDTVDGESVGDRTGNLFDYTKTNRQVHKLRNDDGTINAQTTQSNYFEYYIPVKPNTTYTVKTSANCPSRIYFSDSQKQWLSRSDIIEVSSMLNYRTFTTPNNCYFIQFQEFDGYRMDETTIILVEGSEAPASYEPFGYKVPVTVEGKNLLPKPTTSRTVNGVTYTVNSDGSVTCNGQASSLSVYKTPIYLYASTLYILNGCPIGGSDVSYRADLRYSDVTVSGNDRGAGVNYNCTQTGRYDYAIRIASGYTCNNLTFHPMIRKADIEDDTYEPYHAPVTTSIYLPEPIKMVGDEAEYIDYAEQKMHRVRKNLLPNTATSQTINGVTFTVNSDGSVTCNGTANDITWFDINRSFDIYAPDGRIVSIGNQGSLNTFYLNIGHVGNVISSHVYSNNTHTNAYVHIVIASGYTCDNLTLYPMIHKADIEDDTYEPYIENTDLDVTLPALPTIKGTNTMSVDTAVQPSRMDIKGRIKTTT